MLYLVSPSTPLLRDLIRAGEFGAITTPRSRYRIDDLPVWAGDNACGPGERGIAVDYRGDAWWCDWLDHMAPHADRCLFSVVPDTVGDARDTLKRFEALASEPRRRGFPVALAAQNGLEHLPVPWDEFDVLFIGGDTAWKLGIAAAALAREATERGKRVHMGRVNGGVRYSYARAIGCSTTDGKCVNKAPDKNANRPRKWHSVPVKELLFLARVMVSYRQIVSQRKDLYSTEW